jgi:serine phosphatase RsbU (regulator of sigma subunit)
MDISDTGDILCELHKEVVHVLNQHEDSDVHDGMDLAICRVDAATKEVQYSGAGNPVYHLSGNEVTEYKADFWSIGGTQYKKRCPYKSHAFTYAEGDTIAMFSDGITDQFSNDGATKFGFNRIQKHLSNNYTSTMTDVQSSFENEMDNWMGDHKQLDDMLYMGVRL